MIYRCRLGVFEDLWLAPLQQYEKNDMKILVDILNEVVPSEHQDKVSWRVTNGILSSTATYNQVIENVMVNNHWSVIWGLKIPQRIRLFLWQAQHYALPTFVLLGKRSVLVDSTCRWCNSGEESQDHIFFSCSLFSIGWSILP